MTWKSFAGSAAALAALGLGIATAAAQTPVSADVKQTLSAGGFSAPLDNTGNLVALGSTECGAHMMDVLFYTSSAASTHSRVVFLDGATYLGSYPIDDKPQVEKKGLKFHYKGKLGKMLTCEKNGTLPASLQLDGDIVVMEK